jgi:hypothetical protein
MVLFMWTQRTPEDSSQSSYIGKKAVAPTLLANVSHTTTASSIPNMTSTSSNNTETAAPTGLLRNMNSTVNTTEVVKALETPTVIQTNSTLSSETDTAVPIFDKKVMYKTPPWSDNVTLTKVSMTSHDHQLLIQEAMVEMEHVSSSEFVYTDCHLVVRPDGSDSSVISGLPHSPPSIQFRCNALNDPDGKLQDKPCMDITNAANLCLVMPHHVPPSNVPDWITHNRTALLLMVDSLDYLWKGKTSNSKFTFWKAFLNQASYAHQSHRPFFVWIGNIPSNLLNTRHVEPVYRTWGTSCQTNTDPKQPVTNTMHYYKPIFMYAVFHRQQLVRNVSSLIFLDADISFTQEAFDSIDRSEDEERMGYNSTTSSNRPRLPEAYFDVSPQASLWGTTNEKPSIVMNSAVMGLRRTDWTDQNLALWWYVCPSAIVLKRKIELWNCAISHLFRLFLMFALRCDPLGTHVVVRKINGVSGCSFLLSGVLSQGNRATQRESMSSNLHMLASYFWTTNMLRRLLCLICRGTHKESSRPGMSCGMKA